MGEGDPVADPCAVKFLPLVQGAQQRALGRGLVRDVGDARDEFAQNGIAIGAFQVQMNCGRRKQFAQDDGPGILHGGGC